eukprot:COSAG01_NODE_5812_length_4018_cov_5.428936_1_plen_291_part_00
MNRKGLPAHLPAQSPAGGGGCARHTLPARRGVHAASKNSGSHFLLESRTAELRRLNPGLNPGKSGTLWQEKSWARREVRSHPRSILWKTIGYGNYCSENYCVMLVLCLGNYCLYSRKLLELFPMQCKFFVDLRVAMAVSAGKKWWCRRCFWPRRRGTRGRYLGTTSGNVRGGSHHYNPSARLIWSPQNSYLGGFFLGDDVVSVVLMPLPPSVRWRRRRLLAQARQLLVQPLVADLQARGAQRPCAVVPALAIDDLAEGQRIRDEPAAPTAAACMLALVPGLGGQRGLAQA